MGRPDFDRRFDDLAAIAYRVAFRVLGDRGDAEDVAQEALARAFARWRTVSGHAEPWVARVATNLAISRWRRRRPTVPLLDGHGPPAVDPGVVALDRHGLVVALRALPRRQREVAVLRYLADLPEREVATALGTSVGSVKQHAHRALARLRAHRSESEPPWPATPPARAGSSPVPPPPEVDDVRAPR
jgi:RNA polymerase sigma-70 factor (sigma-E family)